MKIKLLVSKVTNLNVTGFLRNLVVIKIYGKIGLDV